MSTWAGLANQRSGYVGFFCLVGVGVFFVVIVKGRNLDLPTYMYVLKKVQSQSINFIKF